MEKNKNQEFIPVCCGNFERMITAFGWFKVDDPTVDKLLMPYLEVDGVKWRVNNCPSCGHNVRSIEISTELYMSLGNFFKDK
jgi:hypothetical protein